MYTAVLCRLNQYSDVKDYVMTTSLQMSLMQWTSQALKSPTQHLTLSPSSGHHLTTTLTVSLTTEWFYMEVGDMLVCSLPLSPWSHWCPCSLSLHTRSEYQLETMLVGVVTLVKGM